VTYYHNNVTATIYLLQIMSDFDCTRLVYSSSATVYGTPPKVPIPETTRLKADSPYGNSKVMCEAVIEDLAHGMPFHPRPPSLFVSTRICSRTYALACHLVTVLQPRRRAPVRSHRRGSPGPARQSPPFIISHGNWASRRFHPTSLR